MKRELKAVFISMTILFSAGQNVFAESLFRTGISENSYMGQPKSLFSTVQAKTIGDIITVLVDENASVLNDVSLEVKNASTIEDKFTPIINSLGVKKWFPDLNLPSMDGYGGNSQTKNTANSKRTVAIKETITAQVVQVMPNGNLVIQGKKISVNDGETTQLILSGIVDPRLISNAGTISSTLIANLQLAVVGDGTVSRNNDESFMSKVLNKIF
jgi:flagellar L-ring protein precursor FlgH